MLTGWSPPTTSTPSTVTVTGTARSTALTWSDFARIVSPISKSVNLLSFIERVPPFRGGHVVARYFGPVVVDQITDVIFGLRDGIPDSAHPCEVGVYPLHEQVHAGGVGAVVDPFTPGDEKAALELGHVRGGHLAEPDRPGLDSRSAGLDFQ